MTNCSVCSSLTTCLYCESGFYLSSSTACLLQVCGDGVIHGTEQCDDGNLIDGDGCSSACEVETQWKCVSATAGGVSSCYYDTSSFGVAMEEQIYSCNQLKVVFRFTGS